MGDDVRRWRLTLAHALLLFVVVAIACGLLAAARGASLPAAAVGALLFAAAFVRLVVLLVRWRDGRRRGQRGLDSTS